MRVFYTRDFIYKGLVFCVLFYGNSAVFVSWLSAVIEVVFVLIRSISFYECHKTVCCGGCTDKVVVICSARNICQIVKACNCLTFGLVYAYPVNQEITVLFCILFAVVHIADPAVAYLCFQNREHGACVHAVSAVISGLGSFVYLVAVDKEGDSLRIPFYFKYMEILAPCFIIVGGNTVRAFVVAQNTEMVGGPG